MTGSPLSSAHPAARVVPLGDLGLGKAGRVPERCLRGHLEAPSDGRNNLAGRGSSPAQGAAQLSDLTARTSIHHASCLSVGHISPVPP
jgi:hypothetical protein